MKRTVLEVRAILGGREVHLDVIEGFALAEIVVIGGGEQTRAVATDDGLQVTAVDVEGEGFESVHFGSDLVLVEDHDQGEEREKDAERQEQRKKHLLQGKSVPRGGEGGTEVSGCLVVDNNNYWKIILYISCFIYPFFLLLFIKLCCENNKYHMYLFFSNFFNGIYLINTLYICI